MFSSFAGVGQEADGPVGFLLLRQELNLVIQPNYDH